MEMGERRGQVYSLIKDLRHNRLNSGLILSSAVTFVFPAAFHGLAGFKAGVPGIFCSTTSDTYNTTHTYITPVDVAFSIWTLIYIWLGASLIIFSLTIVLKSKRGRIYLHPAIASPMVTATLSISFLLNLAWVFIWDRSCRETNLFILSSFCLFLLAGTNTLATAFLARNITHYAQQLVKGSDMFWWGVVYRVILNGLATYTTWTIVASLINLSAALVYAGQVQPRDAALTALSLLLIVHCVWFGLENFLLDTYTRYVVTPYPVIIWAVSAIRGNAMDDHHVGDLIMSILIIVCLSLVARAVIVVYRLIRHPL